MKIRSIIAIVLILLSASVLFAASDKAMSASSLKVAYVKGDISLGNDSVWKAARAIDIPLIAIETTSPARGGTISAADIKTLNKNARYVFDLAKKAPVVTVKAVHNGKKVAFMLTWDDNSVNEETAIDTFRDGVALMFPIKQSEEFYPSPLMGSKGEPVNIWQWRADYQAEHDGTRHIEARQPLTEGVYVGMSDTILKSEYPGKSSPDATSVEYIAEGYGTLTKTKSQNIAAKGEHRDGKWTVVFVRDLKKAEAFDAEFVAGKKTYINLAVWNGGEGDVNGMKSINIVWTPVVFDAAK